MTGRARIKLPAGAFDLELPDGTVLVGARIVATDRRSIAPDVRIAGAAWDTKAAADERARADAQQELREWEARRARERAEQSARDRRAAEPFPYSTVFEVFFKDVKPIGGFDFAEFQRQAFDDVLRDAARRARAAAPPPPPPPRPALATWRTALGFGEHERPSIAEVKRRHRQRMLKAHPDAGGSHEKAVALNRAMDDAKRELRMGAR